MFLLPLPYDWAALTYSLNHWDLFYPRNVYAALLSLLVSAIAAASMFKLQDSNKLPCLFWRKQFAHPAHQAFMNTRNNGIDRAKLMQRYPEVHDAAYAPEQQYRSWQGIFARHGKKTSIIRSLNAWHLFRDLYIGSIGFAMVFLCAWLFQQLPFGVAGAYLFLFGSQSLFLLLSARRAASRLVDHVLIVDLAA